MQSELFPLSTELWALGTPHWLTQGQSARKSGSRARESEPAAPAGTPAHSRLGLAPQGRGRRAEAELRNSAHSPGRSFARDSGDRSPRPSSVDVVR